MDAQVTLKMDVKELDMLRHSVKSYQHDLQNIIAAKDLDPRQRESARRGLDELNRLAEKLG